jgi:hypothetical protein
MAYINDALAQPTARTVAEHYLRRNVLAITDPEKPAGCLSVQGGLAGSPEHHRVVAFLNESRKSGEARFAERFQRAIDTGDLPAGEEARELAKYLASVTAGMAVQAAGGATRSELERVASRALLGFPAAQDDMTRHH